MLWPEILTISSPKKRPYWRVLKMTVSENRCFPIRATTGRKRHRKPGKTCTRNHVGSLFRPDTSSSTFSGGKFGGSGLHPMMLLSA